MHAAAYAFVAQIVTQIPPTAPVYEIGSRNINGSVRPLFAGLAPYLGIDLHVGPDVDVVGDALTFDPPFTPATIVCCEVVEHTEHAAALVAKACDLLQPGGLLILTTSGYARRPHSALDGGQLRKDEFYRNWSAIDLEDWASGGQVMVLGMVSTPEDLHFVGRKLFD